MAMALFGGVCSCSDFFETESTHYIDADKDHLTTATDTIYSVIGILNKVQAIGDRTILLGELRGDLIDVTESTPADLRQIATFQVDDDNVYNEPRDYYAIINNCNYFIAHADTAMKNNRNEKIFLKEYAAVKAVRAWTYLQLVTTYGRVPFVTKPIMTELEAAAEYPMYDIQQVCDYFINEDGLQALADVPTPGYGDIKGLQSKLFYFPINIVLGDLNLWSGHYLEAAKCYHDYLVKRNGTGSYYATGIASSYWADNEFDPDRSIGSSWTNGFLNESYSNQGELITLIPGDSIPSEGYYSELRSVFNSRVDNEYKTSIVPSQYLIDLSASQIYCYYDEKTGQFSSVTSSIDDYAAGDLRLCTGWVLLDAVFNSERIQYQQILKYQTRNIHIYRRAQIYLRLAEAINRAGFPDYAFAILSSGVNTDVIAKIGSMYGEADSTMLVSNLDFPRDKYYLYDPSSLTVERQNTMGIHSRGCGYTPANEFYPMPYDETIAAGTDSVAQQRAYQMEKVEDLIVNELALECTFEGTRFYDLMRVALHRDDPAYLAKKLKQRNGEGNASAIGVDLNDKKNWFLHWNGQIGY